MLREAWQCRATDVIEVLADPFVTPEAPAYLRLDNGLSQKSRTQNFARLTARQVKREARDTVQTASAVCGKTHSP